MKVTSVSATPNPDALKFTVDCQLLKSGSRSFTSASSAAVDVLANSIYELDGVTSVFYMSDFVTVNKNSEIEWENIENQIKDKIESYEPQENESEVEEEKKADVQEGGNFEEMTPAQQILLIDRIFDDEIRPGLAGDGGGLEIVSLEEFVLQVHYEGACGSCPSSTAGTLSYIESLVKNKVDDRLSVVPV